MKSTSRGSPIVFAKIIVNPSLDQCVPMTETAMTTCVKCKSMAAKINSIYPPNILASVVSCLEKSHVYKQVHPMNELYATHFHCMMQKSTQSILLQGLYCCRFSHGKLFFFKLALRIEKYNLSARSLVNFALWHNLGAIFSSNIKKIIMKWRLKQNGKTKKHWFFKK